MKHWFAGVLMTLSGIVISGTGWAQGPERRSPRSGTDWFSEEDVNADGQVTLLEARAAALAMFEYFDRDADGRVTRAEAQDRAARWREARFEARFASLDLDRDGGLSPGELELGSRRFAWVDRDRNGRVTRAELWNVYGRGPGGSCDTAALRSVFWRRDLNRDGVVTRVEALTAADQRFMRKDRDRDGVLTRGETVGVQRGGVAETPTGTLMTSVADTPRTTSIEMPSLKPSSTGRRS
jgi:Ca2+-binding EF-hand superfamily protein